MENSLFKGSILILLGACCYGMLGVYVKMAYQGGYSTAEVTLAQFGIGFLALFILNIFPRIKPVKKENLFPFKSRLKLLVAGSSLGLTSIFYYMAVKYIPVSVSIILLMQAVWMGVVLEIVINKKFCGWYKTISALVVIIGSILATNLLGKSIIINWEGIGWGILAALSYTATMYSTNNIESHLPAFKRSMYMVLGGLLIIVIVFNSALNLTFNFQIFYTWGLVVALFGTVLPPLLFTAGMPLTGVGYGAILASIEIPVAVIGAYFLLKEPVSLLQWLGIIIILFAIGLMNFQRNDATIVDE